MHVLIVDGDASAAESISKKLRRLGHTSTAVGAIEDAAAEAAPPAAADPPSPKCHCGRPAHCSRSRGALRFLHIILAWAQGPGATMAMNGGGGGRVNALCGVICLAALMMAGRATAALYTLTDLGSLGGDSVATG